MSATDIPPRPRQHDEPVLKAIVELLWPAIADWAAEGGEPFPEGEIAWVKEQVIEAMGYADSDAYQIARNLERAGWEPDGSLVDALDGVAFAAARAERAAVKAWVREHSIATPLPVGTRVKARALDEHVGEVTEVHADEATYLVFCAALGHVREGADTERALKERGSACHGLYLNAEDVTEANPLSGAAAPAQVAAEMRAP